MGYYSKNMNALMISDFSLEQNPGGAQVSNDAIIKAGEALGHSVELMTNISPFTSLLPHYDLLISSNLEAITQKDTTGYIINRIINHPRHVRLEHDSCSYLSPEERKDLFNSAQISFFLSEFHVNFFQELYGDYFHNIFIVYDPIDSSIFYEKPTEPIYDVVYCGFIHPLKGAGNLARFARENPLRKITIFGWPETTGLRLPTEAPNIEFKGVVGHEKTAEIFRSSRAIYHSPQVREPFCRMIGEALLCGIEEVIGDTEKIGSYLEFQKHGKESFKDRCNNAATNFWKEIEKTF